MTHELRHIYSTNFKSFPTSLIKNESDFYINNLVHKSFRVNYSFVNILQLFTGNTSKIIIFIAFTHINFLLVIIKDT